MWEKRSEHSILVSEPEAQTNHLEDVGVRGKIML
jgi:hypothetical protein